MGDLKQALADALDGARQRSLGLLDPLSEEDQLAQHSPLMSPLVWDLAHVGHYEELWLLRAVARTQPIDPAHDDIYDAFKHVRKERAKLAILGPAEARSHIAMVRGRVLDVLDKVELDPAVPLLNDGFVYGMVAQHEHQHDETMLATLQLMALAVSPRGRAGPAGPAAARSRGARPRRAVHDGHRQPSRFAYDNERPAHVVDVAPFLIDTVPVTNRQYLAFVEAGGYDEPRFWSEAGWAHRARGRPGRAAVLVPRRRRVVVGAALRPADRPAPRRARPARVLVRGRRLRPLRRQAPPHRGGVGEGRQPAPRPPSANLGQRHFGPAPVGAYPDGASRYGAEQMLGDVWEWTSSDFTAYPGFATFPYKEYSEVFYGSDYKVLRGGSWATSPLVARTTFRNWDYPIRRQIFAGFRCARDV